MGKVPDKYSGRSHMQGWAVLCRWSSVSMRDHPQGLSKLVQDLSRWAAKETEFPAALFPALWPSPDTGEGLGLS